MPPALESEWDYGACVRWEPADAGSAAMDACFVCGAGPHWGGGRPEEEELLTCNLCAETFHTFCAPHPTPVLSEETRLHWTCQRCRPPPPPPKAGAAAAPLMLPPVEMRCARCDKRRVGTEGLGGHALWVCSDCRCCEGCGTHTARSWSSDGVWCSLCAPAGYEGRYCAVCSKTHENDDSEAQVMIGERSAKRRPFGPFRPFSSLFAPRVPHRPSVPLSPTPPHYHTCMLLSLSLLSLSLSLSPSLSRPSLPP